MGTGGSATHQLVRTLTTSASRRVADSQTYTLPQGRIRLSLLAKHLIGTAQSRGERPYQEDAFVAKGLRIRRSEIENAIDDVTGAPRGCWKGKGRAYDEPEGGEQVLMVSVIDGHGGKEASSWLKENLAQRIEECHAKEIPKTIRAYRELGGYFRRFRGGSLERLGSEMWSLYGNQGEDSPVNGQPSSTIDTAESVMELGERLTLAFIQADQHLIESFPHCGSVATAALLTPLPPTPPLPPVLYPFYSSPLLSLTIAHVGDTKALLCSSLSGRVLPLTENHHPDSRIEAERLRRVGTGLVTDSFGENRWGGALANTRGLGDARFKRLGVTAEPTITKKIITGAEWAFLLLCSDGVSEVMSDQEIVDLCRGCQDPTTAAQQVVNFAEQLAAPDNCTVVVVPLAGWGKVGGHDSTASRREYRLRQSSTQSSRARRQ